MRAALGTGSPNTITRMLDGWRSQLGNRLRELSALPEVPDAVGQVMMELWRLAIHQAERTLEDRFAIERAALDTAQTQLAQEREDWEARLQAAETQIAQAKVARDLAEHACATLDGQLQDSHALRADLAQQRDRLQDQCDAQSAHIQMLRTQLDENQVALRTERERLEAYIRATEDRAHLEVDRARQDAKQWQQRHDTIEQIHREVTSAQQALLDSCREQLRGAEQAAARYVGQVAGLERVIAKQATTRRHKVSAPSDNASHLARQRKKRT